MNAIYFNNKTIIINSNYNVPLHVCVFMKILQVVEDKNNVLKRKFERIIVIILLERVETLSTTILSKKKEKGSFGVRTRDLLRVKQT